MLASVKVADALDERILCALEHAILAPSNHNTQPWMLRVLSDGVELLADRRRACPVVDPMDRELHISCGALLYQLRLALNFDGLATWIRVFPRSQDSDLIARVRVAGPHSTTDCERSLFEAIEKRRTNRFPFASRRVDPQVIEEMAADVELEKAQVKFVQDEAEKHRIADLVSEGDRLQASDRAFCRELSKWTHSNRSSRRDGIPGFAHGTSDFASNFESLTVRTFDWGDGQAAKDRQLAEGSPLLAVISTDADTPAAWVACGQALAKMLLRAASWSVDASFLNQPIEVSSLRPKLSELIRSQGYPQILLRLGYGTEVRPTPRRRLEEMIVTE